MFWVKQTPHLSDEEIKVPKTDRAGKQGLSAGHQLSFSATKSLLFLQQFLSRNICELFSNKFYDHAYCVCCTWV